VASTWRYRTPAISRLGYPFDSFPSEWVPHVEMFNVLADLLKVSLLLKVVVRLLNTLVNILQMKAIGSVVMHIVKTVRYESVLHASYQC
jgi:hypothetical protein